MSMEVASDKLVDLVLALCVQILKLVQVPLDIQTIGGEQIRFPLNEVFTLNSCYLTKIRNVTRVAQMYFTYFFISLT